MPAHTDTATAVHKASCVRTRSQQQLRVEDRISTFVVQDLHTIQIHDCTEQGLRGHRRADLQQCEPRSVIEALPQRLWQFTGRRRRPCRRIRRRSRSAGGLQEAQVAHYADARGRLTVLKCIVHECQASAMYERLDSPHLRCDCRWAAAF